jgi:predicted kinase
MQLRQQHEMGRAWDEFTAYLDQACAYTRRQPPRLLITHGLSGSGKSTITEALLSRLPAVRLRSDVERKRLAGLDAGADSGSAVDQGIYSTDFSQATYQRLELLAQQLLQAGFNVIVDATFLKQAQRRSFQALARRSGAAFLILDFPVPVAELKRRLIRRKRKGCDPSEADVAVLRVQLTQQEPLTEDERSCSLPASRPAAELAALVDGFLCRKKRGESEIGRGGQE